MKNKLSDLNDHLFAQLERLSDEDLTLEQIEAEAKRGAAIVSVADNIIRNADLTFKAATFVAQHGDRYRPALSGLIGRAVTVEAEEE
ncbi:hypothetical protein [Devosia sp.]|uniref:hypothetical protein n=1 Tax=Devosia sp. TaxID=1871048 RepID=UPI002AFDE4C5|nr:hypothetical protein [Devosia sp.]